MNTYQYNRRPPWLLLLCFLLACIAVIAAIEARCATVNYSPEQIERLILWSVEKESCDPKLLPVTHDTAYRREVALGFIGSAFEYNIPIYYLVAIGYRESRFNLDVVGDKGKSLGMMQVGVRGRWKCREACAGVGYPGSTAKQDIRCGTCWLDKNRSWCGTLDKGLAAYVSGKCNPKGKRSKYAIRVRKRLVAKYGEILEGYMEGEKDE